MNKVVFIFFTLMSPILAYSFCSVELDSSLTRAPVSSPERFKEEADFMAGLNVDFTDSGKANYGVKRETIINKIVNAFGETENSYSYRLDLYEEGKIIFASDTYTISMDYDPVGDVLRYLKGMECNKKN